MRSNFITWLTIRSLKSKRLSGDQKGKIMAVLLNTIQAIPIKDIITFDAEGILRIHGQILAPDQVMVFRESAEGILNSYARKVINDQITYEAIKMGVYTGVNQDMILFAKAALWVIQEENKLLQRIIQ